MGINGIENLFGNDFPDATNHDDTDVPAALERETHDGPGDLLAIPPSDFEEVPE